MLTIYLILIWGIMMNNSVLRNCKIFTEMLGMRFETLEKLLGMKPCGS